MFNPNELVLEKIRSVEEYDINTRELTGRYTQIESPSLETSADGTDVTDAMGSVITTFYNAQTGTFSFDNSLFSLDLAASQFGSKKEVATDAKKINVPVSEIVTLDGAKAVLKYVPVKEKKSDTYEVMYVKIINSDNTFGKTYKAGASAAGDNFTIDAETKTITLPEGTTGRVFVEYTKESKNAVKVSKMTDGVPEVKMLKINALFHPVCNVNAIVDGVILCPRAQIDPSSVQLNLTSDGKHSATYKLQKEYCSEDSKLFDIIVSTDDEEEATPEVTPGTGDDTQA